MTRQAQRRYNGMFLGVFELLMIKRMEIQASLGRIDKLKDYWLARMDLDEILSGKLPDPSTSMTVMGPASGGMPSGQGGHE